MAPRLLQRVRRWWPASREPFGAWVVQGVIPPATQRARTYRAVREAGGVAWAHDGTLLVASHALVKVVLHQDDRFSASPRSIFGTSLAGRDGEAHEPIRRPLLEAFAPRALRGRGDWIRETGRATLRRMAETGERDLMAGFSRPLVLRLLADLLELHAVPTDRLLEWGAAIEHASSQAYPIREPDDPAFDAAVRALYQTARDGDYHDALSGLAGIPHVMESFEMFQEALVLLLYAGIVTTRKTIISTVYGLLDHPDLEAALRADRALIPAYVEEILRLQPLDLAVPRRTTSATTLGGVEVPADTLVLNLIEAANRDPDVFDDPDAVRPGRRGRLLTFGLGPHYCPGHYWAREEVVGGLDVILDAWPSLQAAVDPSERGRGPFLDRVPGPLLIAEPPHVSVPPSGS